MVKISGIPGVEKDNNFIIVNEAKNKTGKGDFSSYLGEKKSLDDIFQRASEKYNVPVVLLKAIGKAESDFRPDAVSRCGAQGIMQLMPATAASLGVTDAFDPEQNIMGGAKYIADKLKMYDGDTRLALAAYNAGSNNVKKYGGIPPFEETQNYVKKVMNYINQGVDTGNKMVVTGAPASISIPLKINKTNPTNYLELPVGLDSEELKEKLGYNYSYEDYIKLITDGNSNLENGTYNPLNNINYNAAVMNLFNNEE